MRLAEPVERGDGVIAQHHVAIEHALGQHRLRRRASRSPRAPSGSRGALRPASTRRSGSRAACRRCDRRTPRGRRRPPRSARARPGDRSDRRSAPASSARRPRQSPPCATSTSSSSTQRAQLAIERVGQDRHQPRRFEACPPPVRAALFDHLRQQELRRVDVLRPARAAPGTRRAPPESRSPRNRRAPRCAAADRRWSNSVRYSNASVRTPRSGSLTSSSISILDGGVAGPRQQADRLLADRRHRRDAAARARPDAPCDRARARTG